MDKRLTRNWSDSGTLRRRGDQLVLTTCTDPVKQYSERSLMFDAHVQLPRRTLLARGAQAVACAAVAGQCSSAVKAADSGR